MITTNITCTECERHGRGGEHVRCSECVHCLDDSNLLCWEKCHPGRECHQ